MIEQFQELPELYKKSVERIQEFPSKENVDRYVENSEKFVKLLKESKRVIWIGTGRQEEMADFATRLTKANNKTTFCSKDSSIPYEYRPDDLVVALSSSGETERTVHYAEFAYKSISDSTPVVSITTNENSSLAQLSEKTGGFVVKIPGKSKLDKTKYQERQLAGGHEPLTLGGTLGELYALKFILDCLGSIVSNQPILEYQKEFWNKVKEYDPEPSGFEDLYKKFPEPIDYSAPSKIGKIPNKIIVGGLDLSGVVARTIAIRLAHCAGEDKERRVNYYKDAGNVAAREGDLIIILSGSGQEFWARILRPIKTLGGKIAALTSFEDSPLGKLSDICIEVPGRMIPGNASRVENPPRTPERALFEIRSLIAMESFIHMLVEIEEIPIKAVESKHSEMT